MVITFEETYLRDLYEKGECFDKHHRFQPQIARKYAKVINTMIQENDVNGLMKYGSLHYEHLHGDKEGVSSVRLNDKYRIEFTEGFQNGSLVANVCNITELSNHYK